MIAHQFHGGEQGHPPVSIELSNDQISGTVFGGAKTAGELPNPPRADGFSIASSVPRGVWMDLHGYIKFSTGSDGVNQVWYRQCPADSNGVAIPALADPWPVTPQLNTTGVNVITIDGTVQDQPSPRMSL